MVIPNPVIPQPVTIALCGHDETEEAKASLSSPGAICMAEAQKIAESLKLRNNNNDDNESGDDDGCERRWTVVAYATLTK